MTIKKHLLFMLVIILGGVISAEQITKSSIDLLNHYIKSEKFSLIAEISGDLNQDGFNDIILIVEYDNKENYIKNEHVNSNFGFEIFNTNKRELFVFFKSDNDYRLIERNNDFIPSEHDVESPCLYDPFSFKKIRINKNILQIDFNYEYACNSNTTLESYKFRYQSDQFFLIGYDRQWILKPTTDLKEISSNLLTGRTKITVKKDSILALNTEYWSKHEYSKKITLKEARSLINLYGSLGVLFAPQEI